MRLLRAALANRQIARLEAAWAAASLGTWAFSILFALYAYGKGGAGAVGLAVLVRMLPSAFAAPIQRCWPTGARGAPCSSPARCHARR